MILTNRQFDLLEQRAKAAETAAKSAAKDALEHYEKVEDLVDDYGKKAILTPVTALIFAAWSVVCVVIGAWVF